MTANGLPKAPVTILPAGAATPIDPLLDHAVRSWAIEEENARRLANRRAVLMSGSVAAFALTLAKLLDIAWPENSHPAPGWQLPLLLVAGQGWILRVLYLLLLPPRLTRQTGFRTFASHYLTLKDEIIDQPWGLTPMLMRAEVMWTLQAAVLGFRQRNEDEENRLEIAQKHIWAGLMVGALVFSVYAMICACRLAEWVDGK